VQVYPTACQRLSQVELDLNRQDYEPRDAVAKEVEFRRCLRIYPRGSWQDWAAARDKEKQNRRDEQAAAYRWKL
jgi:hypothetical protein